MGRPTKLAFACISALVAAGAAWLAQKQLLHRSSDPVPAALVSSVATIPPPPAGQEPTPGGLSAEDGRKLRALDEILTSKNDNDPRLDTELRQLSPALKAELVARYQVLPPEARNERGTLVFLLGRQIEDARDLAFFDSVLTEPPCLSMAGCSSPDRGNDHAQLGSDTTLAYPQLVAIRSLANRSRLAAEPELARQIHEILAAAKGSRNPLIARAAAEAAALTPP